MEAISRVLRPHADTPGKRVAAAASHGKLRQIRTSELFLLGSKILKAFEADTTKPFVSFVCLV